MRHPIAISFPGMTPSPWVEGEIRKRAAKLDELCPGILSCNVAMDIPHRHHVRGNLFRLRIDVKVRGEEFVVVRKGVPAVLRRLLKEAFDTAKRQLLDYRGLRRDVKRRTTTRAPAGSRRAIAKRVTP